MVMPSSTSGLAALTPMAMAATAADSFSDSIATTAVLAAMLVGRFTGLMIDGWVGLVVACLILWSGVQAARDTISPLLGQPPKKEFVEEIERLGARGHLRRA